MDTIMNKKYLNQSVKTSLCALLIAPLAVLADGGNDAKWEIGVGAATRVLGKTKFYGGIDSSAFESALGARSGGFSLPGDLGDQTQGSVDREYDDGFVRRGSGTDNIPATTNWGYDSASQVNAQADSITFSRSVGTSAGASSYNSNGESRKDRPSVKVMPYFELSRIVKDKDNENIEYGFISTFTMLDTSAHSGPSSVGSMGSSMNDIRVVDTYNLNVIPPSAPYEGSFNPPGPLLGFLPDREIIETPSGDVTSLVGLLEEKVSIEVQTLSFGALARRLRAGKVLEEGTEMSRLSGQVEGGVTFNRMDLEWDRDASIMSGSEVVAQEKSSDRDIKYRWGAYTAVGGKWHLDDAGEYSLGVKARYDYLDEEKVGNEDAGATVDLSSWSFIITFVRNF